MGGNNAKPAAVLKMEGTYNTTRMKNRGVKTGGDSLRKPPGLRSQAAKMWDHVTRVRALWLSSSDAAALQALCEAWQLRWDAHKKLKEDCSVVKWRNAFAEYNKQFIQYAARFGLTPSDRARLGEDREEMEEAAKIEQMLA